MPRNDVLDPREARFVALYFENPNATQAYLAAGFQCTVKSAGVMASRLLAKPRIAKAIAIKQAQFLQRYEVTQDRLIAEFSKIAFSNVEDFIALQDDGSVIVDFSTATREQLAALASIEVDEEFKLGEGDEPQASKVRKIKFKQYDKQKALVELARLWRMYPAENVNHTGQVQHLHAHAHKIDIASLEPEQREQLRGVLLALKAKSGDNGDEDE